MRYLRSRLAVAGLLVLFALHSFAVDVKVIANPSVKAGFISMQELRNIFLAESNTLRDGSHVEPVFEREGVVHETFLKDFLKQTNASLQSHYGELVFTGKASMPKSFNSDAEVVAYVARTRGAIGYVGASADTNGVEVLDITFEGGKADRKLITRVEPEYPETLRRMRIGGTVRLEVTISPQGSVQALSLLGGNPILGEAAMAAVKKWKYAPAPSTTTLHVTIPFETLR
jgi:TonB family protein